VRWGIVGLIMVYVGAAVCSPPQALPLSSKDTSGSPKLHMKHPKKTHHKGKHHKKKKFKHKVYSEKNIQKLLENDHHLGNCNRLECSSNLQIAKSCLKTKSMHRRHTACFRSFCAYGCNDKDYHTKAEVYDFCNQTCSSKKYLKNKKRPE
jgi:hypothetical protein